MKSAFDMRMARVGEEMKRLYLSLYHDEHAFEYFAGMLRRCLRREKRSFARWMNSA